MSAQIGYIDSDGHPRLTIRISGPDPAIFIDEDALIDTGFTGFLMLPETKAFGLGIVPATTANYTLADDSLITNYVGSATVTVRPPSTLPDGKPNPIPNVTVSQPEVIDGTVVMCGKGALVGMEFIRRLDKWLVVGSIVVLLDGSAIPTPAPVPPVTPGSSSN